MDTAGRLELILIFVLQLEGLSETVQLYKRPGQDAALPCGSAPPNEPTCSAVDWFYSRDGRRVLLEVESGNVRESSARAARLSVDAACSLVINTVTAEDVGLYTCLPFSQGVTTYLSVMTISSSPPDADPTTDDEVTLTCSLVTDIDLQPCGRNSIRWVDETGRLLLGDGDGYTFIGQTKCDSVLTVRRQSDPNRRYTCQFIDSERTVAIQADYTPVFKDPTGPSPLSVIMMVLRIAGLILMILITVLIIRNTCNTKLPDSENEVGHGDDVQYENVETSPAAARMM